jgi:hypothetical protein
LGRVTKCLSDALQRVLSGRSVSESEDLAAEDVHLLPVSVRLQQVRGEANKSAFAPFPLRAEENFLDTVLRYDRVTVARSNHNRAAAGQSRDAQQHVLVGLGCGLHRISRQQINPPQLAVFAQFDDSLPQRTKYHNRYNATINTTLN